MSANFVQVSSIQGRTQTLVPSAATQTYQFRPQSLRGTLPGGDFIYASRIRVRVAGQLTRITGTGFVPNWQKMAQAFGQVRVYSQFLGDLVNKSLTSVPILANHDAMFDNGFGPPLRQRDQPSVTSASTQAIEYEFAIPLERKYMIRPTDPCPWLPFLEGGEIDIDLRPSNALAAYGFTMSGNWTMSVVIDWFADKQALIHAPVANRLYRVITGGPEYILKGVGGPNGLDGVVQGARLAVLSWLGQGTSAVGGSFDNGFYAAFGGGGVPFGTAQLNRLDIPFRDQVSIDEVSAWIGSFLGDTAPVRPFPNTQVTAEGQRDLAGWPFMQDAIGLVSVGDAGQSYIRDGLDFFPLIWPSYTQATKISDMQKVDGDLSFTVGFGVPQGIVLNLFRTEEVCGFTAAKVMDLMERMGLPHVARGGRYDFVPKYAGAKRADDTTQWGMPLKIVAAK